MRVSKAALAASTVLAWGLGSAALAQPADSSVVEEVVVTSQKRAQNVQNVPIAVTAFTAQALEAKGIREVAQLSNSVPNVTLDAGTPFSGSDTVLAAYIRGIGQNDFAFNFDPGVGVYVDGVYLARSVGANTSLLDVQRVEVLKGPQGTLFGRNTIGGAISIVTRDPGDSFMFRGEVTGGRFNRLDILGTADLPINDKVRTSVSFSSLHRQGYQKRIPFPGSTAKTSGIPDCDALATGTNCAYVVDGYQRFPAAGYQTSDREGGQNSWTVRGKVLLLPSDKVKVTLTGDYTKVDQSASASSALTIDPNSGGLAGLYNACLVGAPLGQLCTLPRGGLAGTPTLMQQLPALSGVNTNGNGNDNRLPYDSRFVTGDIDTSYATGNSFSRLANWGVAGTLDWELAANLNLKSITAFRKLHWRAGMDLDGSPLDILHTSFNMPQKEFSEELQLTGKTFDDRLDFVVGAYYFKESGHLHDFVTFPGGLLQIDGPNDLKTRAWAVYFHTNFKLTDKLSVTAGGRYTDEHKTFEGFQTDDNALAYKISGCYPATASALGLGFPAPNASVSCQAFLQFPNPSQPYRYYPAGVNAQDFTNFAPKLGIEYHPSDTVMIYGSWSKGFKTGSWTTRLSNPHPTYDATLHFDPEKATSEEIGIKSELFERRMRLNIAGFHTKYRNIQLNSQQGISPTFLNAGDARIWGFEVEAQAVVNSMLSVNSSLGYLDAKYTRVAPGVGDNGVNITTAFKLPKTPELKFNIGPQVSFDLANNGKAQVNLDYTHTSTVYNDLGNTRLLRRPVIDEFNLSGTYKSPDGRWEITTGVTNLTDKRYVVTGQNQGGVAVVFATYNRPREWFATLRARF
jgi:iron complex outermembrane receptor protein